MKEIIVITLLFIVIVSVTGFTDQFNVIVTWFLFLYLVWHLFHLYLLNRYLNSRNSLKPAGIYGIWGDIFSRIQRLRQQNLVNKHTHNKLQIELLRYIETVPDAVIFVDSDCILLWANSAATTLLGVSRVQDAGVNINRLFKDQTLTDHLKTKKPDQSFDMLSPVDQSVILSSQIHRPEPGNLDLVVIISRDITKAYYTEQSKKDLVTNVSHELKTPLTVIKGFLELMSDSKQELGHWAKSAYLMQTQADRMQEIIDSLLLLSKIQQDQASNEDRPVNIHDILLDIINQAELAYSEKKPAFTQSICRDLFLVGNENYLYSIFSNLIFNAIIHNASHCQINIQWQTEDPGHAVFVVDDKGEGIASRHLNRLTERFYRVDKGRSQNPENSTGLGLAIVKHALQYHQAHLEITSKTGHGSRFKCVFPAHRTVKQSPA